MSVSGHDSCTATKGLCPSTQASSRHLWLRNTTLAYYFHVIIFVLPLYKPVTSLALFDDTLLSQELRNQKHIKMYRPPPGPPPGWNPQQQDEMYRPPPGPPPGWTAQQQDEVYDNPPPYHNWQDQVPDTAMLPPPPAMSRFASETGNASGDDAGLCPGL